MNGMNGKKESGIEITMDGPYRVTTDIPLIRSLIGRDKARVAEEWIDDKNYDTGELGVYYLCRCGRSHTKPFCDGHHEVADFVGREHHESAPYAERARHEKGPALELLDDERICSESGFCELNGTVWEDVKICDSAQLRYQVVDQVARCPSGRLCVRDKAGNALEKKYSPEIHLVEDPDYDCRGPLWVRGGVEIRGYRDHVYEERNRVTLCRCGESKNKPFCDGSHYDCPHMQGTDD